MFSIIIQTQAYSTYSIFHDCFKLSGLSDLWQCSKNIYLSRFNTFKYIVIEYNKKYLNTV